MIIESLPSEITELDALRLENTHLKFVAARDAAMAAAQAHEAVKKDISTRYQIDLETDAIDVATRKITRKR